MITIDELKEYIYNEVEDLETTCYVWSKLGDLKLWLQYAQMTHGYYKVLEKITGVYKDDRCKKIDEIAHEKAGRIVQIYKEKEKEKPFKFEFTEYRCDGRLE